MRIKIAPAFKFLVLLISLSLIGLGVSRGVVPEAAEYNKKGDQLYQQGDYERAAQEYLKAIQADPKYAKAHYNLATVYDFKLGRDQEALEHYTKYLSLSPLPLTTVKQRVELLKDNFDYRELKKNPSVNACKTYIRNHPEGIHLKEIKGIMDGFLTAQEKEIDSLGKPDAIDHYSWLWHFIEIHWFWQKGAAVGYWDGKVVLNYPYEPLEFLDPVRCAQLREEVLPKVMANKEKVELSTPVKLSSGGMEDYIYTLSKEQFFKKGTYFLLSKNLDMELRKLINQTTVVQSAQFEYVKKMDISNREETVTLPGYQGRCDLSNIEPVPLGRLVIPKDSKISRMKIGNESVPVQAGEGIFLPPDRYNLTVQTPLRTERLEIIIEAQQDSEIHLR